MKITSGRCVVRYSIADSAFFDWIEANVEALNRCEAVNAGQSISVFEITTAAALLMFSETPADYLLLEVGLGGRYDATNVIERPAATVITPVSFDHPEFLGATVDKIAYEKAGILRRGAPAVIAAQEDSAMRVIEREALRVGAPRIVADRDFHMRAENGRLVFEDRLGLLDLPVPRLRGRHHAPIALQLVSDLDLAVGESDPA